MNTFFKRALALFLGLSFPMLYSMSSFAYSLEEKNFDYIRYADDNPDLYAIFGYDKNKLYEHYSFSGKKEGRLGHILPVKPKEEDIYSVFRQKEDNPYDYNNLDTERYARDNPDVAAALGTDPQALWNHYSEIGYAEGRKAYGLPYDSPEVEAKKRIFSVAKQITKDSMTDREKIKAVHDWIINNTVYDEDNYQNNTIPEESYDIRGVMLNKTAVCSGYANTFDYFMYVLGIQSEVITGNAINSRGSEGRHGWNRVLMDDTWLYVDCTWDDPVSDRDILRYKYFLCTEGEIGADHFPDE